MVFTRFKVRRVCTDSSTQFLLTLESERFSIYFDIGRTPGHVCVYNNCIADIAFIAFRENLHVSMEAQLILNKL